MAFTQNVQELSNDSQSLQNQLDALRRENTSLRREKTSLQSRYNSLQSINAEQQNENFILNGKLVEYEKEINFLYEKRMTHFRHIKTLMKSFNCKTKREIAYPFTLNLHRTRGSSLSKKR